MASINYRQILNICTLCGIKYGKNKKPNLSLPTSVGNCDICEETGNANIPQTLRPVEAYLGLNQIDTANLVDKE